MQAPGGGAPLHRADAQAEGGQLRQGQDAVLAGSQGGDRAVPVMLAV
jgi:hypothetical protein